MKDNLVEIQIKNWFKLICCIFNFIIRKAKAFFYYVFLDERVIGILTSFV